MSLLSTLTTFATSYYYTTGYNTATSDTAAIGGIFAALAGMIWAIALIGLAIAIVIIIAMWKIFTKMGMPGWYAIIPYFNLWKLYEAAGMQPWFALIPLAGIIPIVGWIASIFYFITMIFLYIRLSRGFGKESIFALGLVLLNPIFMAILGFGSATWDASKLAGAPNILAPANAAPAAGAKTAGAPKEDAWVAGDDKKNA